MKASNNCLIADCQIHFLCPLCPQLTEASHTFTNNANDWGFTQFLTVADAMDESKGYVIDDKLELKVSIKVQREDQVYRMTREETGFVGLKNQGATCYMNSLLQYLYHISYFRKVSANGLISMCDVRVFTSSVYQTMLQHKTT